MHVQTRFSWHFVLHCQMRVTVVRGALGLLRLVVVSKEVGDRVRSQLLQLVVMNREVCHRVCGIWFWNSPMILDCLSWWLLASFGS